MMIKTTISMACCMMGILALAETAGVKSPNGKLEVEVKVEGERLTWNLKNGGQILVNDSRLGLKFGDQEPFAPFKIVDKQTRSSDTTWQTMLYRRGEVRDHFNELTVMLEETKAVQRAISMDKGEIGKFARKMGIVVRAYDEGITFRYVIPEQPAFDGFQLMQDLTEWRLPDDPEGWITTYKSHFTSQEEQFVKQKLGSVPKDRLIGMPVVLETKGGAIALCEANLTNWAGMFYRIGGQTLGEVAVEAVLTPLPKTEAALSNVAVIRTTPAESPWRVVMVGDSPLDLLNKNDIIVNLNPPPEEGMDFSWVKPGPSSWDWWTDSNNSLSTELTLKMIDFAAEMGWTYHTIDGGWYGYGRRPNHGPDVKLEPRKGFDLEKVVAYGKSKNIGIWVWIHWMEIDDIGIEETFSRLERWGVKGVKTDFLNRQDQWMVNWYERVCRAAAKHHVMVNFHGAHKPTGTERTWPNNLTREGILGNEMNKFKLVSPEHCATLPFTRFLIGPGDFTPGSFGNVFSKDFVPQSKRGHRYGDEGDRRRIWAEEVGTRAQALAKCIAYDSPLTTICDWPERYRNAPGCNALKNLPTSWKSTRPIAGQPGEFYAVLRESHDGRFYFAAFSVKRKTVDLKLDFLDDGEWKMGVFADDAELTLCDATAIDTAMRKVKKGETIKFSMIPEGGAVAMFERPAK